MVVKGISKKIFRRIALESCLTVHLEGGLMTVSEDYPAIHLGGLSNIFIETQYDVFKNKKIFFLKLFFFSHLV